MTPREAWLTQPDRIFIARDGCRGTLTECHITDETSAHPHGWMFRLSDPDHPDRWHWEQSLREEIDVAQSSVIDSFGVQWDWRQIHGREVPPEWEADYQRACQSPNGRVEYHHPTDTLSWGFALDTTD